MMDFPSLPLVNYDDIRDKIWHGDILLASGFYEFSKLIKIATNSWASHVAPLFRLDYGSFKKILVAESVEGVGVRVISLSKYVTDFEGTGFGYNGRIVIARHKQFESLVTPEKLKAMADVACDRLSYHYGNESIANITKRVMLAALGLPLPAPQAHEQDICSEHEARVMKEIGISFTWDKRGFIAPDDIADDPQVDLLWELIVKRPLLADAGIDVKQ